jgi:hypothetical protein
MSSDIEVGSVVEARRVAEPRVPEVFEAIKVRKLKDKAEKLAEHTVLVCGQDKQFKEIVSVGTTKLADAIINPGSHVLMSPCQSGKSYVVSIIGVGQQELSLIANVYTTCSTHFNTSSLHLPTCLPLACVLLLDSQILRQRDCNLSILLHCCRSWGCHS